MSKRILLKLSGEALSSKDCSIDSNSLDSVAAEIGDALKTVPIELAIVIGAGNIWRGGQKSMDRVTADKIGMLATVMNAIALKSALINSGFKSQVFASKGLSAFVKDFDNEEAVKYLKEGYIVIFAGGTGSPFFTTDTGASLRAAEIKADIILKATQVDGVYSADPKKDSSAFKFDSLTYSQAIEKGLNIMDCEAFELCKKTEIPICVFNFHKKGNLKQIISGQNLGTIISK